MYLNVKQRIDNLDISRNKLAVILGISYPTLQDMYNGKSVSIRLDTLEKLCRILNCTPNDILVFSKLSDAEPISSNTPYNITQSISELSKNPLGSQSIEVVNPNTKNVRKLLQQAIDNETVDIHLYSTQLEDGTDIYIPYFTSNKNETNKSNNDKSDTK